MGSVISFLKEQYPPKSQFHPSDIPDLAGKVIIVTGGSAGLGKETARELLAHNAKVYIASYDVEKSAKAIKELKEQTGKEAVFLKLDLADLNSVQAAAEEFKSKEKELHVLFNNAGILTPPMDLLTAQGFDAQFGVNVLGHFLLTKLLLPTLLAGAASSPDKKARVVNTSSVASLFVSGIDFNTLRDGPARRKQKDMKLYMQSKLGNILFSHELARRYGDQGIVSTSLNPGNIKTDLQRHQSVFTLDGLFEKFITYDLSTGYGTLTQLYAGTAPEAADFNGKYLIPWARVGTPGKAGQDSVLAKELWTYMEEQVASYA